MYSAGRLFTVGLIFLYSVCSSSYDEAYYKKPALIWTPFKQQIFAMTIGRIRMHSTSSTEGEKPEFHLQRDYTRGMTLYEYAYRTRDDDVAFLRLEGEWTAVLEDKTVDWTSLSNFYLSLQKSFTYVCISITSSEKGCLEATADKTVRICNPYVTGANPWHKELNEFYDRQFQSEYFSTGTKIKNVPIPTGRYTPPISLSFLLKTDEKDKVLKMLPTTTKGPFNGLVVCYRKTKESPLELVGKIHLHPAPIIEESDEKKSTPLRYSSYSDIKIYVKGTNIGMENMVSVKPMKFFREFDGTGGCFFESKTVPTCTGYYDDESMAYGRLSYIGHQTGVQKDTPSRYIFTLEKEQFATIKQPSKKTQYCLCFYADDSDPIGVPFINVSLSDEETQFSVVYPLVLFTLAPLSCGIGLFCYGSKLRRYQLKCRREPNSRQRYIIQRYLAQELYDEDEEDGSEYYSE